MATVPAARVSFEKEMDEWAGAPGKRHSSNSETEERGIIQIREAIDYSFSLGGFLNE